MRIAVIADPLDNQSAGVHTFTRHLVETLIDNRGEHEIVLIREKLDKKLTGCDQIVIPNIKLPIGFASFRLFLLVPLRLIKAKVDVVIEPAHFGPFNLPQRTKRVTMIHDLTPLLFPQYHRWHSQLLQRIFLPGILRRTDLILSNSENTSQDIAKVFPKLSKKIKTLLLGKDDFYTRTTTRNELDRLGISDTFFHYVGTIEPRKDLVTLLEAFALFRKENPTAKKVQLIITGGKGWKSEGFFQAYDSSPYKEDILITGYLPKSTIRELHSHSNGMIYPSKYEGFGLPILEALSCGSRVICARNSSLPEVGGEMVNYFQTGDVEDLVKSMVEFNDHPLTEDGVRMRAKWSEKFSWETFGKELFGHLERLIEDRILADQTD